MLVAKGVASFRILASNPDIDIAIDVDLTDAIGKNKFDEVSGTAVLTIKL